MSGEQLSTNKLRISKGNRMNLDKRRGSMLSDMAKNLSRLRNRKLITVDLLMSRKKMN
jgi:hypothetical protein